MKKNFLYAALAASVITTSGLTFTSCSNDDSDSNQVTETNVVADDASALSLVNGVYSHWQPLSSSFSFVKDFIVFSYLSVLSL